MSFGRKHNRTMIKCTVLSLGYVNIFKDYLNNDGKQIISMFDERFKDIKNEMSCTKKLDFVLWQNREKC